MLILNGFFAKDGKVVWLPGKEGHWSNKGSDCVKVCFQRTDTGEQPRKREWLKVIAASLDGRTDWITPSLKDWVFDLDKMKVRFPDLEPVQWFKGVALVEPEMETQTKIELRYNGAEQVHQSELAFYIYPDSIRSNTPMSAPPVEISESLVKFQQDHPDPSKVAFIMMQFGQTTAHDKIVDAIRKGLEAHGIKGLRADDKNYHDDLMPNVLTYLWGCGFGVAVYERLEDESVNPNVSLEVGYLLALRKPVCLLKDKTLKNLNTDLIGKIHVSFDPQSPGKSISGCLSKWLSDKELV